MTGGDICLVDPKAKVKTILHFKSMPHVQAQSMATLRLEGAEPVGELTPQQLAFEVAAMQALDPEVKEDEFGEKMPGVVAEKRKKEVVRK